jgi:SAM-dependent methyltransferase
MMSENEYHQIPYLTGPMVDSHPDRLASVATLFGMTPAPIAACRVLEIGCGSGGNLIPMAFRLPGSHFTGIDLADQAIAEGQRFSGELALSNLNLIAMDLRDIGPPMGEFDYIIAHGVYSWVPDPVRERLLAVCRERLAPQGIAYISYNALPGRYVRTMLREMMIYHTRNCEDPRQRMDQARWLLRKLGEAHLVSGAWQPMVEAEINLAFTEDDGWFYHDDLEPVNDPFYFRDFAARAAQHSLQYLGDARPHLMFDSRMPIDWVGDDVLEREQYFDFLCLRAFRQTLLCKSDVRLERPAGPERMDHFLFSSPARERDGQIEGRHSVCMSEAPEPVARVAAAMGAAYPVPVAFDELLEAVQDRDALRGILFTLISSGFAALHTHRFEASEELPAMPHANRLARWESAHGGVVTATDHTANKLDEITRALIELMDGTRDFDALAAALAQTDGGPSVAQIQAQLPYVLDHLWRAGLLEPPL